MTSNAFALTTHFLTAQEIVAAYPMMKKRTSLDLLPVRSVRNHIDHVKEKTQEVSWKREQRSAVSFHDSFRSG